MTNLKISNLTTLPETSEKGHIYVLSSGIVYVGKSNGEFLQLGKEYVDEQLQELESSLTSDSYRIVLTEGQTTIPINNVNYTPDTYVEFLFDNTTKVFKDYYTIQETSNSISGYEIVFNKDIDNIESRTFELILLHGKAVVLENQSSNDSRFHEGQTKPDNNAMIWVKTY